MPSPAPVPAALNTVQPWWVVAVAGIAAAGVGWLALRSYVRRWSAMPQGWRGFLVVLRLVSVLLLLGLLLEPVTGRQATRDYSTALAVYVDVSRSMDERDSVGGRSRIETALTFLRDGRQGILHELGSLPRPSQYRFSSRVDADMPKMPQAPGDATDLAAVLRHFEELHRAGHVRAALLLSDGRNNVAADDALIETAIPAPVFCVGIGKAEPAATRPGDLAVADVSAKRVLMEDTVTTVTGRIQRQGLDANEVRVAVIEGDRLLADKTIDLKPLETEHPFEIDFSPPDTGYHHYEIVLPTLPQDAFPDNNRRRFSAVVIDPELKALYVEGRPRWEFKYVRRVLEETPGVRLLSMVRTTKDTFYVQGVQGDLPALGGFPETYEALSKFNVVLLGSGGTQILDAKSIANLTRFVDEGHGLIVLGSEDLASLSTTPLSRLLPAEVKPGRNPGPFALSITTQGRTHPVFQGLVEDFERKAGGAALQGRVLVGRMRSSASVLARGDGDPLLLAMPYGKGRVLLFGADNTWSWALTLSKRGAGDLYGRFWLQAIRWAAGYERLATEKAFPVTAYTDKDYYHADEDVLLTVESRAPVETVQTSAGPVGGEPAKVDLVADEQKPHVFTARLPSGRMGEMRVVVRYADEERTLSYTIGDPLRELTDTRLNADLLKAIAYRSGGRYFTLAQRSDLLEALSPPEVSTGRVMDEPNFWRSPWAFFLFVLLATTEWFIRRRKHLV